MFYTFSDMVDGCFRQTSLDENALTRNHQHHPHSRQPNGTSGSYDEQEMFMNIFPDEDYESRHRHPHRHGRLGPAASLDSNHNNRTRYLKAVISEHETSTNLQANDLAYKDIHEDNKMMLSSSSAPSSNTASSNNSEEEAAGGGGGERRGVAVNHHRPKPGVGVRGPVFPNPPANKPGPPARPIVFSGRSGVPVIGKDYGDGTVTRSVNGLPSTEI
jgi:hypothetical protein